MADENIEIKVQDKVSPSISNKLRTIATESRNADAAVKNLQLQLNALNGNNLNVILQNASQASRALQQTTIAAQRLATEQQRTASAAANAAAAQTRATTATTQGATAQQRLAAATARTSAAQTQGQTAAQRLATEQQRTAAAAARTAAANDRAAIAAIRLQQAQDRQAQSSRNAASAMGGYIRTAAGIAGVTLSAGAIIGSADAYVTLQNKLQNVAESQAQVNMLTEELFSLANETRASVTETATAFTRFDRALRVMGKSQEDSLRLTETVNKALIVSGATAQEASSALLQLSQAFNAGRLQGDEFRAVSENMPIVLDAVAQATGRPITEIKKLASEGKITSEVLYKAFSLIQQSVDDTFAKTTPTIGQSLTVLSNSAKQFFGELNKSTGFTATLSKLILALANNMDILAAAIAVVGAAFLAYFGSSIVTAITTATRAVGLFTAAIAANPIGLLLVGISAAISAIVIFGDKIKVTSDGLVTLKDVALAVWSFISDGAKAVGEVIQSVWNTAIDWINEKTNEWGEQFRNIGDTIMKLAKGYGNFQIAVWVGAYNAIKVLWNNFPALMQGFFASVVNFGASAVELLVNSWQVGLRGIAKLAESIAPDMSKSLTSALDSLKVELPRMDVSQEAKDAAGQFGKAFTDAFQQDYLGDAGKAIMDRASQISAARRAAEAANSNTQLRGAGPNQLGADTDEKAAKAAERRALALQKINTQLDNEMNRMFTLQPQREAQAKFDQIEESLILKKIKLNDDEKSSIMAKIVAIQNATVVQQKFDEIYNNSIAQQRDYNASLEAAQKLLDMGAITKSDALTAIGGTDVGQYLANSPEMVNAQVTQYQNMYSQIDQLRQADLISEQTAASAKLQIWNAQQNAQLQTATTFFSGLAQLQNSSNKRLAAIGKAAAITQAIIQTYQSATGAYAAMSSIPYVGPALGAAAAAAAIAAGMANVAAIRAQGTTGYMTGGYTGDGPQGAIAGVVHGQEFVMNAAATNRIGVANLQALQSGAASVQGAGGNAGGGQNVGKGGEQLTNVQVPVKVVNVIDPSEALNALNTSAGERLILNVIERNPNTVRKMVGS